MRNKKYPSIQIANNFRAVICLILFYLLFSNSSVMAATSGLWGTAGESWDPRGRLPDYSYAGYRMSEAPLPTVSVVGAFDVTQPPYNADPAENTNDDTDAIQNAIDAAAIAGGGVVYLPPGHYRVERILRVQNSNIVLKGAGVGQTKIYFPFSATEAYPPHEGGYVSGGSGNFINFQPLDYTATGNAYGIVQGAERGDKTLVMESDALPLSSLKADDYILFTMKDDAVYGSMYDHFHNGQQGAAPNPPCDYGGPDGTFPYKIERIEGNLVTFYQPFAFDMRTEWMSKESVTPTGVPVIYEARMLHECGIEDIHFEFRQEPKQPHLSEVGFNAIKFSSCVDSWIRNVRIDHSDNAIMINNASSYVTVDNVTLGGRDGHHGISAGSQATSVLIENITTENLWLHTVTISGTVGCVISKLTALTEPARLDFHRAQPIETLWTEITNWTYWSGGNGCQGPHTAARATYWNLSGSMGVPQNDPGESWGHIQCNVIGNTSMADLMTTDREWYENTGASTTPANLFESQLIRRLSPSSEPLILNSGDILGDRNAWFERDPSRWKVTNSGVYRIGVNYEASDPGMGNVALAKSATQSTTNGSFVASNGVDGITGGGTGNITHTQGQTDPWWEVDLGESFDIGEVKLYNRSNCCQERLDNYYVFVKNTPFTGTTIAEYQAEAAGWHQGGLMTGVLSDSAFFTNTTARYVRVALEGGGRILSLEEVEVFVEATAVPLLGEFSVFNQYNLSGDAGIAFGGRSIEDFGTNPDADYAAILGYQDSLNYYYASLSETGVEIVKVVSGAGLSLGESAGFTLPTGWNDVVFERSGNDLRLSFEGVLELTVTDTQFMTGKAGFGSLNDQANFRNISFIGSGVPVAPVWTSDPLVKLNAVQTENYSSENQSITKGVLNDFYDLGGGVITVTKISQNSPAGGTNWLTIAESSPGSGVWQMSGIPQASDVGVNTFTIEAEDDAANKSQVTLQITVLSGEPVWLSSHAVKPNAEIGVSYTGQSINIGTDVVDYNGDNITFSKVSGPAWMNVDAAGNISGTPGVGDIGANDLVVRATDDSAFSYSTDGIVRVNIVDDRWVLTHPGANSATLGLWRMNDDEVGTADGQLTLSGWFDTPQPPAIINDADSRFGSGLEAYGSGGSGVNDFARVNNSVDLFPSGPNPDITVECWVRLASGGFTHGANQYIVGKFHNDSGYELYLHANGTNLVWRIGDVEVSADISLSDWFEEEWVFIAGTWDASTSTASLYLGADTTGFGDYDMTLLGFTIDPDATIANWTSDVHISNRSRSVYNALNGRMDDLQISSTVYKYSSLKSSGGPVWADASITLPGGNEGSPYSGTIGSGLYVFDPEGATLTFSKISKNGPGTNWLNVASNGTLSGTPNPVDLGSNSFTVRASDGSNTADVNLIINVESGSPVWVSSDISKSNGTLDAAYNDSFIVGVDVSDPTGDTLTFTKVSGPAWLTVNPTTGALSGTPGYADVGPNDFVIRVTDNSASAYSADANLRINVASTGWALPHGDTASSKTVAHWHMESREVGTDDYELNIRSNADPANPAQIVTPATYPMGNAAFGTTLETYGTAGCGVSDIVEVNNSYALFPEGADPDLTVEFWVKFDTGAFSQTHPHFLIDKMGDVGDGAYRMLLDADEVLEWRVSTATVSVGLSGTIQENVWYHLAGTWDSYSDTAYLYMDGNLIGSTASSGSIHDNLGTAWLTVIGNRAKSCFNGFDGMIDELRISNVPYVYAPASQIPVWAADLLMPDAVLSTAYNKNINVGEHVFDPEGSNLTFSKINQTAPAGGTNWLNVASNGTLSGTPQQSDLGVNIFTVRASDGSNTADVDLVIIVKEGYPEWEKSSYSMSATLDNAFSGGFTVGLDVVDPGGDNLAFSIANGPSWLNINSSTGALSGTPGYADVGPCDFVIRATDDSANSYSSDTNLRINVATSSWILPPGNRLSSKTVGHWHLNSSELGAAAGDLNITGWSVTPTPPQIKTSNNYPRGNAAFGTGLEAFGTYGCGVNDLAEVNDSASYFPTDADPDLTVEFWVKFDTGSFSKPFDQFILDKMGDWGNGGYRFYLDDRPRLNFVVSTTTVSVDAPYYMNENVWYHIAGTWDSFTNTASLYLDGTLIGTTSAAGSIENSILQPYNLTMGNRARSCYFGFDGFIDEVRVSNVPYVYVAPSGPRPIWASEVQMADADPGSGYSDNIVVGTDVIDPQGNNINFSKVGHNGPGSNWLNVASNGTLSGTPQTSDSGFNSFIVRARDNNNNTSDVELIIFVTGGSVDPYVTWKSDNGVVGNDDDDDDNDGISNLAEYALGGAPSNSNDGVTLLPTVVQQSGNSVDFSFNKSVGDSAANLSYYVESSNDLSSWSTVSGGTFLSSNTSTGLQTINIPFTEKIFVRLRIEKL